MIMQWGKTTENYFKKLNIYDHSWHSLSNSANKEMYLKNESKNDIKCITG